MANQPFNDVFIIPGTSLTANLESIICGAPRGASDQYKNVSYFGDVVRSQPTGAYVFNLLNDRFQFPTIVIAVS